MPRRRCCATCFGDRLVRNELLDQCDPLTQDCDYCRAPNTSCIEPQRLGQWFETLLATYEEDEEGDPIITHLMSEWGMFSGSGLSHAEAKDLLADVLDDGEIVRKTFKAILHPSGGNLHRWEELREELMHVNRWFLAEPMDLDRLSALLTQLIASPQSLGEVSWFRARLISNERPFELGDMKAPPPHLAGHGRANPAGIPYLYLGSTRATAVAELRPHTGERACIARFELDDGNPLKLADLRQPRALISPLLGDESQIIELRADLPLLERLGEELTRPMQPRGVPYEYVPTQYLCEYIKTQGFDGVLYRSSVTSDDGINIALFNTSRARPVSVEEVSVSQVTVTISS